MKTYTVNYDGWLEVEAEDKEHAFMLAYKTLMAPEALPSDGALGEWYVNEPEEMK